MNTKCLTLQVANADAHPIVVRFRSQLELDDKGPKRGSAASWRVYQRPATVENILHDHKFATV